MKSLAAKVRLIIELNAHEETRCLKNWCLSRQITSSKDVVDDNWENSKDNIDDSSSFLFRLWKNVLGLVFVGKFGVEIICHYYRMSCLHSNIIEIYDACLVLHKFSSNKP